MSVHPSSLCLRSRGKGKDSLSLWGFEPPPGNDLQPVALRE